MGQLLRAIRRAFVLLSQPRKLFSELSIAQDYVMLRIRYPFLAKSPALAPDAPRVLIVSLSNWIPQLKLEGMLAKALQGKGQRPVLLTWRSSKWAQAYFKAFGIRDLLFFDDLMDRESGRVDETEVCSLIGTTPSFASLHDMTYRGTRIGKHVLGWFLRLYKNGSFSFGDAYVNEQLQVILRDAMKATLAAEKLFTEETFRAVLFMEKGYSPYGPVFDCALKKKLNTIQFLHPHMLDRIDLKRYDEKNFDMHCFSVDRRTWEKYKNEPFTEAQEEAITQEVRDGYLKGLWFSRKVLLPNQRMLTADALQSELQIDRTKKTAVVFSHILWDATFFYGRSLFQDYEEWLVETVKTACANTNVNWIIKLHPDYVWKMKSEGDTSDPRDIVVLEAGLGSLPSHVKVVAPDSDISTLSFIDMMDYCITVRGTIGIEAACFGIPVLTAGTGRYSHFGFTNDSETREDYLEKIAHIQNIPRMSAQEKRLACLHADLLFNRRPLKFKTFEVVRFPLRKVGHPFDHDVVIRARSMADVRRAEDLRKFANWVVDSKEPDYITS